MLTLYDKHILVSLRDGKDPLEDCSDLGLSDVVDITNDLIIRGYIGVEDYEELGDDIPLQLTEKGRNAVGK